MTLQKIIDAYNKNGGKPRIIKRIKTQEEAEAFRHFLLMEIYRHIGDIHNAMNDVDAVTKTWNLSPETLDEVELNTFCKVRE